MASVLVRPTLQNIHRSKKFAYITFTDNSNVKTTEMDSKINKGMIFKFYIDLKNKM